jgi:hypothetical protein
MNINDINEATRAREVLDACRDAWTRMAGLRHTRQRCKDFTYGRQWGDTVTDAAGRLVTEGSQASSGGRRPMTNNMIRQLVKCVIGRYRDRRASSPRDNSLNALRQANQLDELDCRALEEFLISGCAIQRVAAERRPWGHGVWVDNINPRRFFVNAVTDIRGWDAELVGSLRDMSLTEVVMRFSHGQPARADSLKQIYRDSSLADSDDSFSMAPKGRCRVIEAWTLESRETIDCHDPETATLTTLPAGRAGELARDNDRRRADGRQRLNLRRRLTTQWRCRYLSPAGDLLDTSGPHSRHPYVFKLYPLTDGEIHSLVEDIIDQQKCVNRLITLIDHIMSTSAKGALLFPFRQKLDNMTWDELGRQWASCEGIIPYDPRSGEPQPQQLRSSGSDAGAYNLLNLELKLFKEISGVSDALTGQSLDGANGSTMLQTHINNATIAMADLLDTFAGFALTRDTLMKEIAVNL